jgi:hypothetical protein
MAVALSWWTKIAGSELAQGDLLSRCLIPQFADGFGEADSSDLVGLIRANLIVVTQSCDLANGKSPHVALCPIFSLSGFEDVNPVFAHKGRWEEARKGRIEGLHLLASPEQPENNRNSLVVDFRQIYSLPFGYLSRHAEATSDRWRLNSPYLEHFSQAFARFFMRVGLPSSIHPFNK